MKTITEITETQELFNTSLVPNMHVLTVKYSGATNTRGSRILIRSDRFERTLSIPYNYDYNSILGGAEYYLHMAGFDIIGHGEIKDGYVILTNTFKAPSISK